MQFTLTPYQRLNLYNQYSVLRKLSEIQGNTDDAEMYERYAIIVSMGYTHEYMSLATLYKELSKDDCKFVMDVLNMYSAIYSSFVEIGNSELSEVDISFRGFDGNNEADLLNYCEFLLFNLKCYPELTADGKSDFNSHLPRRATYNIMLQKWNEIGLPNKLTEEQIRILINMT